MTLSLVITRELPWLRGLVLLPAQLLGAMLAAWLASTLLPGDIASVNTGLARGISSLQGLFIEALLTCELVITVLMLAAQKSNATFIAPLVIGLALFVAELAGIAYTGASLNPARSFGPAVVSGVFPKHHWVYWAGPFLGAAVTSGYYGYLLGFKFQEANPGQDRSGEEVAVGTERA